MQFHNTILMDVLENPSHDNVLDFFNEADIHGDMCDFYIKFTKINIFFDKKLLNITPNSIIIHRNYIFLNITNIVEPEFDC